MRPRSIWFCISALFLCALPAVMPAQQAAADKYAAEPLVIDRSEIVYAMNADGTGYMQKTVVAKIQSQSALQQLGIIGMGFAANSQHVEFHYVRVRRPDGSVTETPISGVLEQPLQATVQAPFYSDLKVAQIPVKNLQIGDTLEWEARLVITKPEAANEFWDAENLVTEGAVVREQSLELRVPAGKSVTVWTNPALGVTPKESKDGDWKVYRWETSALKPTVGAEADAAKEAKKKHVLTAAEEMDEERGKLPSVAWTTFPSWAAVGEWYRGLEASRAIPDDEIKAKVAELTAGKTTDEDKVRAIYEYVSTQVRYIGVAFGVGRYQPHMASDVLNNQYGDCKDKATLLSAMLAAAGVQSDAALIGAGVRFNEAVPSPGAFNHLITHLNLNGTDVWLDSTEEIAPYRMMYAVLRDREALVVPATGTPAIEKTPKDPPFAEYQTWTAKGTLDATGTSESQITIVERGDDELQLRSVVRQLGPAQYDDFTQRLLGVLGYAGTESHAEFSRTDTVDEPFKMSFAYHREKAGDWDNLKIIPQLAPAPLPYVDEKNPPTQAISLGVPRTESSVAEMKLPAGWTAELPEAVHEKTAFATYDLTYRFDKGTLYSERKVVVLESKVPAADWKTYKKFADAAGVGNENYVQLRQAKVAELMETLKSGAPENATVKYTSDPKAEVLLTQAQDALNRRDNAAAATLLEQAQKLNPQQRMLWSEMGRLAESRGDKREALQDMMTELSNHADEDPAYQQAVRLSVALGERRMAEETLEKYSARYPTNPLPLIQLSELQLADNEVGKAEENAARAMGLLTDYGRSRYPDLQLTLGVAEMRTGKQDKGLADLKDLLNKTENPVLINNAAFELADADKDLALAERKQRAALETMTRESATWNITVSEIARAKTSQMISAWDTMGWILFREGRTREAKQYIEAAWLNRPGATLKKHLDALNAKAAIASTHDSTEGREVQTYSLGSAGGRSGVAEYRLLIAHDGILQARAAGDKAIDGGEDVLRRAKLRGFIPEGSEAELLRNGMLTCHSAECELVLLPVPER